MTSPQILLLFIAMGGLIAYLGDWLGRRMGKKRLRIGKLRPRHTATFFTVAMGMLIPIATTYGLVTQSKEIRQWIVEGPDLAREKQRLEDEIETNQVSLVRLENDAKRRQNDLKEMDAMRSSAEKARDVAVKERNDERTKLEAARAEIRGAEAREREITRRVEALRKSEISLQDSVSDLQADLAKSREDLQTVRRESSRLYEETEGLKQFSTELTRQIVDLEGERDKLLDQVETARREAAAAEADVQRYFGQVLDLRRTIADLEGDLVGAAEGIEVIRSSNVIFRKDEELARLAIPANLSRAEARAKIDEIVRVSDVVARERGVSPDSSGKSAALQDRLRRLPDGTFLSITVEDQINAFVNEIVDNDQELLLIASSFYNYFSRETSHVPLNVNIYPNRTVFRAGERIAETVINGAQSEDSILEDIFVFLRTQVRLAAEEGGMIPIQGPDVSIGEISYAQLSDLVRRIRERNGPARVIAEAAQITKSSESLTLRFRVRTP